MSKTFNLGIQGFKRMLKQNPNLSKSDRNKAIRIYKNRLAKRLKDIATQYALDKEKKV